MCRLSFWKIALESFSYLTVWGPAPIIIDEGYGYYSLFMDDFIRFLWNFPLKNTFEAKGIFIKIHRLAENEFDKKNKNFTK